MSAGGARTVAALALCAALLLGVSARARADGDPAGEYLPTRQLFVLSGPIGNDASSARGLSRIVAGANRAGFPIRVAVIASSYELGPVDSLWRRPRAYARFLGQEISRSYRQRLLVVMPNGFGFHWGSRSTAAAYRQLAGVRIAPSRSGEIAAARSAVLRLAAAGGVSVAPASVPSGQASSGQAPSASDGSSTGQATGSVAASAVSPSKAGKGLGGRTVILIAAALLVVLALAVNLLLWLRGRGQGDAVAEGDPAVAEGDPAVAEGDPAVAEGDPAVARTEPAARHRRGRALLSLAALFGAAVGLPILAVGLLRGEGNGSAPRPADQSAHTETPFVWGRRQRRAPAFTLTDQAGRPISPASFRGRPVIVTFIDPVCRNLCPLEAKVLNEVDEGLPAARRPVVIAISVDVFADSHAQLMLDARRWSLTPLWHWAIGTPSQLKAAWRRYYAEVEVKNEVIAGTVVHNITHSEMSYVLDAEGYERALFSWPFSAKAIERTLQLIEHS